MLRINRTFQVILADGQRVPLDRPWLARLVEQACADIKEVSPPLIVNEARKNIFNGVAIKDIYKAMVMSARTLVETEPNYSFVTATITAARYL